MLRLSWFIYLTLGFSLISTQVMAKKANTVKVKTTKAKVKKENKAKKSPQKAKKLKAKNSRKKGKRNVIRFKDLNPKMQKRLQSKLKAQGIKVKGSTPVGNAKDNCPSSCNDRAGGGFCFCSPDSKGNCPAGTEDYPVGGGKKECRAEMDSVNVSTGNGQAQKLSF